MEVLVALKEGYVLVCSKLDDGSREHAWIIDPL